ncbi:hypothetical protein Taro_022744 [Colocasia esculenta]|uniref:RING-type E3 ubiquitin transferase n=1 Tax=Colocasia esculenta TaxID=4460 RepID=A0A843V998_COLES|nr:hypothetical protein [Colocasia esculenta]
MSQRAPSSLRRRSRRVCRLFWCHQCLNTVRVIASPEFSVFCPRCYGHFLHELDFPRPRLPSDYMGLTLDPSPFPHFLDYLSAALGLSDSWVIFRQTGPQAGGATPDLPLGWREPARPAAASPSAAEVPRGNAIPPTVQPGDYFMGPRLSELIEGLTQNDRPGPPPAPASAIDAMPTVSIEEGHLAEEGSQCPVCKEDWRLGEDAREMPCKHVYHSDCIVPWLQSHNSCPVCRHSLLVGDTMEDDVSSQREEGEEVPGGAGGRPRRFRWNPFTLLWPFRSSSPNWGHNAAQRHAEMDDDGLDGNRGNASSC